MLICSVKGSNLKIIAAFILSAVIIAVFVALVPPSDGGAVSEAGVSEEKFEGISSLEKRVEFLKNYGWEVEEEAHEVTDVTIPAEFDNVYKQYNELPVSYTHLRAHET